MSYKNYSPQEISEMSMIEIVHELLEDERRAVHFNDLYDRVAEIKGFTAEQKEKFMPQLFTDLNSEGRYMTVGSNMWGLKRWYPVDQTEEDVQAPTKKTKRKKPAAKEEADKDLDESSIEEDIDFEDEDLDLDEDGTENSGLDGDYDLAEESDDDYEEDDTLVNDEESDDSSDDEEEEEDSDEQY
ncbi:DNA-directed RNA polymerase subunit delta [Pontibacillus halophilus JSM 076056 = DSM 19796]|uniref:Probable DNA-directed RNA polymerase subunit delta n=1 Tax=Pontibacillus halophilus JSM 076056 = DSM 19796 TaxID=1385510 RepID=A0A0A5IDF0_9BACI|nr:DNA-directed RNA polymerase subunit delta [Pontibacillus halophilus]KGX93862.1 DNA-directed RNA polymerase subunit delta [Pontibacillus halophilus JSM 076056 = DSM 19796]